MKERYGSEIHWTLRKLLGVWRINKQSVDTKWGYFAPRWGLELKVNRGGYFKQNYSLDFCLIWGMFHITLPFKTKRKADCEWLSYGINTFEKTIMCYWGEKLKILDLPFVSYRFEYHRVVDKQGKWIDGDNSWDNKDIHRETYNYTYTLESGEVQHRKATCFVEERQWRRKWVPYFFPFSKMIRKSIEIEFNDEVGERSGSWKGGTLGCGYDMKKGETMEQTLRRMEKERKM